jgi:hypothetical protein
MTKPKQKTDDERDIIVTIDTAANAPPAIALAVALARTRRQALHGLFLEDEDLLRVARLPFSREFHRMSGRDRGMSDLKMERAMARLAAEFRAALEQQAQPSAISWSFSSMPGSRQRVTRAEGPRAELLVIAAPVDQRRPERDQILLLDWERPGVLRALANVLETRQSPFEILLWGSGDSEPVRQLLAAYPGSELRALGDVTADRVFLSVELRPVLVLAARDGDLHKLEDSLRLARCPVLVAA